MHGQIQELQASLEVMRSDRDALSAKAQDHALLQERLRQQLSAKEAELQVGCLCIVCFVWHTREPVKHALELLSL